MAANKYINLFYNYNIINIIVYDNLNCYIMLMDIIM